MAATLSADGVVLVSGTDAADAVVLRMSAGGTDVQVQGAGEGIASFRLSGVCAVKVDGGGGDDTLTIDTGDGLIARADAIVPIAFDGGAGNDVLELTGAPAGLSVNETITPGPAAGAGKIVSQGASGAQSLVFSGVESLVDTSAAASLTVKLNDNANLVEVVNGAASGGVATGTIRAFDVTPCQPVTATVAPATMTTPASAVGNTTNAAPATDEFSAEKKGRGKGKAKGHSKKAAPQGKAEKKAQAAAARAARKAAKAAAKAAKAAAKAVKTAAVTLTPAPPASQTPQSPQQALLIGVAHVPIQFANKAAITIDTAGGDDWVAVDHFAPAAGLKGVTVNAGDGQDHFAEVALPTGVAWSKQAAEDVSSVRTFLGVTECPPGMVPSPGATPSPTLGRVASPPPTPVPGDRHDPRSARLACPRLLQGRPQEHVREPAHLLAALLGGKNLRRLGEHSPRERADHAGAARRPPLPEARPPRRGTLRSACRT